MSNEFNSELEATMAKERLAEAQFNDADPAFVDAAIGYHQAAIARTNAVAAQGRTESRAHLLDCLFESKTVKAFKAADGRVVYGTVKEAPSIDLKKI